LSDVTDRSIKWSFIWDNLTWFLNFVIDKLDIYLTLFGLDLSEYSLVIVIRVENFLHMVTVLILQDQVMHLFLQITLRLFWKFLHSYVLILRYIAQGSDLVSWEILCFISNVQVWEWPRNYYIKKWMLWLVFTYLINKRMWWLVKEPKSLFC